MPLEVHTMPLEVHTMPLKRSPALSPSRQTSFSPKLSHSTHLASPPQSTLTAFQMATQPFPLKASSQLSKRSLSLSPSKHPHSFPHVHSAFPPRNNLTTFHMASQPFPLEAPSHSFHMATKRLPLNPASSTEHAPKPKTGFQSAPSVSFSPWPAKLRLSPPHTIWPGETLWNPKEGDEFEIWGSPPRHSRLASRGCTELQRL